MSRYADMKMKSMLHIYTISELLFLIGDFEVAPLEKHVYSANMGYTIFMKYLYLY